MASETVSVAKEKVTTVEAKELLAELAQDFKDKYGKESPYNLADKDLQADRSAFIMARVDGRPAGCVILYPQDENQPDIGEARQLYVRPEFRGLGLSYAVMRKLEETARANKYTLLRLVTGLKEPEAIHLFLKLGYSRIPRYTKYIDRPLSACFEKKLD
jgi:GNAT superfamily N-acetyltransferase